MVLKMKKFLDLIVLMNQVKNNNLYDYWSTNLYV